MLHRVETLKMRCTNSHVRIMDGLEMIGRRRAHALRAHALSACAATAPSALQCCAPPVVGEACLLSGATTGCAVCVARVSCRLSCARGDRTCNSGRPAHF